MKIEVSSRVAHEEMKVTVIDGCAFLWISGWPAVGNVQTYINALKHKIKEDLSKCDIYLFFIDIMNLRPTIQHDQTEYGRVYQLTPSKPIPAQAIRSSLSD